MFKGLKKRLHEIKDSLNEVDEITIGDKAGALLKGEVILDKSKLDDVFSSFEISLLENDIAFDSAEDIISDIKTALYNKRLKRNEVESIIINSLRTTLKQSLPSGFDIIELVKINKKKPFVIIFVGVNGTGKTTTIAKIARLFQNQGLSCVLAASDTFRAGAIEQLDKHASNLGVKLIKHTRGADPAAVAYDAIEHSRAHNKDVVLIDTAGRIETNTNLMDEMRKISRVVMPDLNIFVGDALTGNAAIEQAKLFNKAVSIDGVILTKSDADAKGGSAISIGSSINKPILYLGTGQEYDDIIQFDSEWFLDEILK